MAMVLFICGITLGLGIGLFGTMLLHGRSPLWAETVMAALSFAAMLTAFVSAWETYRTAYSAFMSFGLLSVILLAAAARAANLVVCIRTKEWDRGAENLFALLIAATAVYMLHRGIVAGWEKYREDLLYVAVMAGTLAMIGGACEATREGESPFRLRAALFVSHLGLAAVMCFPVSWFSSSDIDVTGVVSLVVGAFFVTCLTLLVKLGIVLEAERQKNTAATA